MPPTISNDQLFRELLLIVCTVLDPFVDTPLLQSAGGTLVPVPNASDIEIDGSLKTLAADDKQNGTHNIAFIVNTILSKVQNLGFTTELGAGELLEDMTNIGDLVNHLADGASPN